MSEHVSTTEFQTKDTACMDKRNEKPCTIEAYNQRHTDLRRHGKWEEQGLQMAA